MRILFVMLMFSFNLYGQEDPIVQQLKEIKKTLEEIQSSHKKELEQLENRIKTLEIAKPTTPPPLKKGRVVEEDDIPTKTSAPGLTYGSIRIKNDYVATINVSINGVKYIVPKGGTKLVEFIPSGKFEYIVTEAGGSTVTRNLKPDEIYNITVYTIPDQVKKNDCP